MLRGEGCYSPLRLSFGLFAMINGIINVYKEKGFTSFDVVAKLRGITHQKKIGHTGTLDPDAVGVLPVCFGNATKVCELLTDKSKTYETEFELGYKTDTQDISGQIIEKSDIKVTKQQVIDAINSFVGEYNQIPPMYSAKKVNGKKLYELARNGIEVERKSCKVEIHQIEILDIKTDENNYVNQIRMTVSCSKGTYIRTLCNDIGEVLGTFGTMISLKRTRVGAFIIEESLKLNDIEALAEEQKIDSVVLSVDRVFDSLKCVKVQEYGNKFLVNGNSLYLDYVEASEKLAPGEQVRVYNHEDAFCAIYQFDSQTNELRPVKMFLG